MTMKRSREKIVAEILEVCVGSASKTRIVYQTNLNFNTVKPHLNTLTKKEFLQTIDGDPVLYKTTDNGIDLLKRLQSIQEDLS